MDWHHFIYQLQNTSSYPVTALHLQAIADVTSCRVFVITCAEERDEYILDVSPSKKEETGAICLGLWAASKWVPLEVFCFFFVFFWFFEFLIFWFFDFLFFNFFVFVSLFGCVVLVCFYCYLVVLLCGLVMFGVDWLLDIVGEYLRRVIKNLRKYLMKKKCRKIEPKISVLLVKLRFVVSFLVFFFAYFLIKEPYSLQCWNRLKTLFNF